MWAICGSVGLAAPWANAAPLKRKSAARPVLNLTNMEVPPFHAAEWPCINAGLDAAGVRRFPTDKRHSKQRPLPVILLAAFDAQARRGGLRLGRCGQRFRAGPLHQLRIVIGGAVDPGGDRVGLEHVLGRLSLIHISEPTRLGMISYA